MSEKRKRELEYWILDLRNYQFLYHLRNCKKCKRKWNNILSHMLERMEDISNE